MNPGRRGIGWLARGAAAPAMRKVRQADRIAWRFHGEGIGEDLAIVDVQSRSVEQEGIDREAPLDDLQVGQLEPHRVAAAATQGLPSVLLRAERAHLDSVDAVEADADMELEAGVVGSPVDLECQRLALAGERAAGQANVADPGRSDDQRILSVAVAGLGEQELLGP